MRLSVILPLLLGLGLNAPSAAAAPPGHTVASIAKRNNWGNDKGHDDNRWDDGKHGGKNKDDGHGGWRGDHDKGHDGGHGGHGGKGDKDHDGDHGHGKGDKDKDCEDPKIPTDDPGIVKWILENPNVETNFTLPESVNDGGKTQEEMVDSGEIPTANTTAPLLNGANPAQQNASDPATSKGGLNVTGSNSTHMPLQGTNRHAAVFVMDTPVVARRQDLDLDLDLTDNTDYNALRVNPNAQPEVPLANPDRALRCEYEYEHVLGGNGTVAKGALWALEGYVDLVAADVHQGGIGDCGMGAAVMALAAGGWTPYLKKMFIRAPGDNKVMVAILQKDGQTYPTLIDDQLPVLQNANPNCWPYPGYQPVNDAADPGPLGNYPPTPIFFMPLFEKAFAKFLDFAPDWRAAPQYDHGYVGLEGVNPHFVLAAITGGTPKATVRTKDGFDGPIIAALIGCMRGVAPCVIGTTNSTTLDGLGVPSDGSIWLNPGGSAAVPGGYIPGETSGLLATDSPKSKSTYTVIDFDQIIKTPQGDRSTALTMVGNHAYAFEWTASTRVPFAPGSTLVDARMRILNPWGVNPVMWPGGAGGGGGAWDDPSQVSFSFRSFAQTIVSVFTVENMPPL